MPRLSEARHFWRLSSDYRTHKACGEEAMAAEAADEIADLAMHATDPSVAASCRTFMAQAGLGGLMRRVETDYHINGLLEELAVAEQRIAVNGDIPCES